MVTGTFARRARTAAAALTATGVGLALTVVAAEPARAASRNWELAAMDVPQAQALSKGKGEGLTIAIVDTGVEDRHRALKGKVTQGPDYVPSGVERGHRYWGVHGTAMAYDALKVAPKAKILSIRATLEDEDPEMKREKRLEKKGELDKRRDGDAAVPTANAIEYAVDHGADVISMSLGLDATFDMGAVLDEQRAIGYAVSKGVPVIASAGNEGRTEDENYASFPAGHAGVIAVAASQPGGSRAEFSTVHTYNDIAAPGVDIFSATPSGGYRMVDGTSPAGALVAGVVTLMKSRNPKITPGEIRAILRRTAHHPPGGRNPLVGYGQIDAGRAVAAAAKPPKTLKAAVPHKGKTNFAAPNATERMLWDPVETSLLVTAGVGGLLGVLMLGGGILLMRRRKRTPTPAGPPTPPPAGPPFARGPGHGHGPGSGPPPPAPGPGLGPQGRYGQMGPGGPGAPPPPYGHSGGGPGDPRDMSNPDETGRPPQG